MYDSLSLHYRIVIKKKEFFNQKIYKDIFLIFWAKKSRRKGGEIFSNMGPIFVDSRRNSGEKLEEFLRQGCYQKKGIL